MSQDIDLPSFCICHTEEINCSRTPELYIEIIIIQQICNIVLLVMKWCLNILEKMQQTTLPGNSGNLDLIKPEENMKWVNDRSKLKPELGVNPFPQKKLPHPYGKHCTCQGPSM